MVLKLFVALSAGAVALVQSALLETNPTTLVPDVVALDRHHPALGADVPPEIVKFEVKAPDNATAVDVHGRSLEETSRDIQRLEEHFKAPMETRLSEFQKPQYRQASFERAPWPSSYWPIYQDGINARWDPQQQSPAEKYARAFGLDPKAFMDKVSATNGVDSMSRRRQCKETADCASLGDGSICGKREGQANGRCIPGWFGICHAWAPAAILEREPRCAVQQGGVTFQPFDIKALLTEVYDGVQLPTVFTGARFNGPDEPAKLDKYGRYEDAARRDLGPGFFHIAIANIMGRFKQSFIVDVSAGAEVWNQPVRRYDIQEMRKMTPSAAAQTYFGTNRYVFNTAAASVVYVKNQFSWIVEGIENGPLVETGRVEVYTRSATYEYLLELDRKDKVIGGEWVGDSRYNHPDFLWFAISKPGADAATATNIKYKDVQDLLERSIKCEPVTPTPTTPAPTTPTPTTPTPTTPIPTTPNPTTPAPTTVAPVTPEPTTVAPVTPVPTTVAPATPEPTTVAPVTPEPTTVAPATPEPTTVAPTTPEPTTVAPTTPEPTTVAPATPEPTTVAPATPEPTTVAPTTPEPTTVAPTTPEPTTVAPVTPVPTTVTPVTPEPTTVAPVTPEPTTVAPATPEPTTVAPATPEPTTVAPATPEPTTIAPATPEPTTVAPTTPEPTTVAPVTPVPTTVTPVTPEPTTVAPVTPEPTTVAPTTPEPTSVAPATPEPTTVAPTTPEPTTVAPTTPEPTTLTPATPAPTTSTPSVCGQTRPGVDFHGADLRQSYGGSQAECCELCGKTLGCKAYTYIRQSYAGYSICFLKHSVGQIRQRNGAVSGEVATGDATPTPSPSQQTCQTAADGYCGNAIEGTGCCPSGSYCQPWNHWYYQCRPVPVQCTKMQPNVDFHGANLAVIRGLRPGECCKRCGRTRKCTAFTFVAASGYSASSCFLKASTGQPRYKAGAVSGLLATPNQQQQRQGY
ncbi:hypothetical protein P43SY_002921 [Pythium insidiosum]|uniref:Apple domain-containing protein n=1 Tax=Pythium insidiosum TaxID=114742 RepID=A0AAD5M2R6_PYTIN|nr:hypothetical protein P43SY_002921 [Pythium insidiosum]